MGMEIRGPSMGQYDPGYRRAVQNEMARSIKSNILKEVGDFDDQLALALQGNIEDMVFLSPEAKAYLKKLRRKLQEHDQDALLEDDEEEAPQQDFNELLDDLDTFRKQSTEKSASEQPKNLLFPRTIQLSAFVPHKGPVRHYVYSPVRETIDRMTYYAPNDEARKKVQDELEPMGATLINQVRSFGAHIIVLNRNQALTQLKINGLYVVAPSEKTFDGRSWTNVRGLYDNGRRLLVVGEEQLGRPGHSVARHEFGHAYDNAFSEGHGRRITLSVELWNRFRPLRTELITEYAGTNPAEYFAESVEAFFQPDLRNRLQSCDPMMYSYLEDLFAS